MVLPSGRTLRRLVVALAVGVAGGWVLGLVSAGPPVAHHDEG